MMKRGNKDICNRFYDLRKVFSISVVLCFFIGINTRLSAQLDLTLNNLEINSLSEIYNIEINNSSGNPYMVYFAIELRQNNRVVYEAITNKYSLIQPISLINESILQPIQVAKNEINRLQGKYDCDIRVIDATNQQVLYADRFQLESRNEGTNSISKKNNNLRFEYSGQANIYGQMASMQGINSQVPINYLRAEIYPDASVNGIPIGMDILYSTEQNAFRQSMNQIALRFDAQQFKKTMQKRLQSNLKRVEAIGDIGEVSSLNNLKEKVTNKKFPKLKEWEEKVNDPKIQEGLTQLKQLKSLDLILSDPSVAEALARKQELASNDNLSMDDKEELKRLEAYDTEINKMKEKADVIRSTAAKYEQYKDLNSKISKAKKYANKDLIKDPSFLNEGLKSFGGLSKAEQLLTGFDEITLGTSYPYYSRLSLSSLAINGLHVAWNPGKIYVAASYGKSARQTYNTSFELPQLTMPQNTLATKFGYGAPHNNHLYLTYINIEDSFTENSLFNDTKPQSNKIIGTEGQLSLFSDNVKLSGELMGSVLTRDNTIETEDGQDFRKSDIPLNSLYGAFNNSSSFDIAWKTNADVKLIGNKTKLKGSLEKVGANYFTLGSPNLLNDIVRWKAEVRQQLLSNKITLSAYARQDINSLDPLLTSSKTTIKAYGISGSAHFPNLPSFTFSFAPYSQNNDIVSNESKLNTSATMLNLIASYPIKLSNEISSFTQVSYMAQNMNSDIEGIDYNIKMYGINQSFTYKNSNINIAANFTPNQVIGSENKSVVTLNTTGSLVLFGKWRNTLGIQYISIKETESKSGYFINSTYPLSNFADWEIRVQQNIYTPVADSDRFNEKILWTGIRLRWKGII